MTLTHEYPSRIEMSFCVGPARFFETLQSPVAEFALGCQRKSEEQMRERTGSVQAGRRASSTLRRIVLVNHCISQREIREQSWPMGVGFDGRLQLSNSRFGALSHQVDCRQVTACCDELGVNRYRLTIVFDDVICPVLDTCCLSLLHLFPGFTGYDVL